MAKTHPKVDVVTIGAGWTSAILGAKLCPKGHDVVAIEQGPSAGAIPTSRTTTTACATRVATR